MPKKQGSYAVCGTDGKRSGTERSDTANYTTKTEYEKGVNPMQIPNPNAPEQCENEPLRLTKRIDTTTYKVAVYFSRTSKETMGDKILRLIENEAAGAHKTPKPIPTGDSAQVPQTPQTAGKSVL